MTGHRDGWYESPLEGVDMDGPLREMRGMMDAGKTVLQVAVYVAQKHLRLTNEPLDILNAASETKRYRAAVDEKDWPEADLTYAKALRRIDLPMFKATIDAEGWARALNVILSEKLALISTLYRGMDLIELPSYKGGTFQSRVEKDGELRIYKALSMYENSFMKTRPAVLRVRVDKIRSAIKMATYTALPRPLKSWEERIGDGKYLEHATETECRIPDGTRVPSGTTVEIRYDDLSQDTDWAWLDSVCKSLEGIMKVSLV